MTTFSVLCYLGLYAVILYLCWFLQKKTRMLELSDGERNCQVKFFLQMNEKFVNAWPLLDHPVITVSVEN